MKRQRWFREWLSSSAGLQIFSLILAILSWIFVNSGQVVEQKRVVKIQYLPLPKGLAFQRIPQKEFQVDLTGSLYRLRSLRDEDLVYVVDLSAANPGALRVNIELDSLAHLPLDVEASHPVPRSFQVYLEETMSKQLPLKPVFIGSLKEGYAVSGVTLNPPQVTVQGPRSLVSRLEDLNIEISLDRRESSFSMTVKPRLTLPEIECEDTVTAEVSVGFITNRKEFERVPVEVNSGKSPSKVEPPIGSLVVEGTTKALEEMTAKPKIVVSAEGLKTGRYRLRGHVTLPEGVKVVSLDPPYFLVEILK